MPLHQKFLINLAALALALLVCAPSSAIKPGGCYLPEKPEPEPPGPDYTADGKMAPGYLTMEWVPTSWPDEETASRFEDSAVILESYLPYPNPYSHAVAFVAVDRPADFRLEVRDSAEKVIDAFIFMEVEPGFYRFNCERMLPATAPATVILWWDGYERGRSVVQEKFLMPGN